MSDDQRLFLALWPDPSIRAELAAAAAALAPGVPARPVRAENFHLTVAFIGTVPAGSLHRIQRIGRELRPEACTICFDAYEYWPKPEVVVAAARVIPAPLQSLWDKLHRLLAADGFELRAKKLRPHVTLSHRVASDPQLPVFRAFSWLARDLCLVRSETDRDQLVYTVVDTWPLLDKPARA